MTNKIFAGWYQESKLRNLWDFGFHTINKDTTLYAKWKDPIDFNQTFNNPYQEVPFLFS